eukprot:jgi/Mesvir1/19230/Mv11534-RA.1
MAMLRELYEVNVIRGALDNCGNNIEDAIRFLTSLTLDPAGKVSNAAYASVLRSGRAARPHTPQTCSPATPLLDRQQGQDVTESESVNRRVSQASHSLGPSASCPAVEHAHGPPAPSGSLLESPSCNAQQLLQQEHDQHRQVEQQHHQQQQQEEEEAAAAAATMAAVVAKSGMAGASSSVPAATTLNMSSEEGGKWVELLMQEMAAAGGMDDARARATKILLGFGAVIQQKGAEECARLQMEKAEMKLSMDQLVHDSSILKRAVQIQNQRVQELQSHERELVQLREAVAHFQEQLKAAEKSNYALSVHLRQAQQASLLPRHFHPDVF